MTDKPKLYADDTKSSDPTDTGLYGSNVTGEVSDVEDSDDEGIQGSMTNPDKAEQNSTLDTAHDMSLYTEYSDDGEGEQGEVNVKQEFDELDSEKNEDDNQNL